MLATRAGLLARSAAGFARDLRGAAAVEFAILLPLMLTLYIGGVEVSQGIAADRKVTITARTVADLVSRVSSVNNAGMTDILGASSSVVAPFAVANLTVTVSQVAIDSKGNATITWSDSLPAGNARAVGQAVTLPAALATPNTWLIWGEAQYNYTPVMGYVMSGTLALKDHIYMAPRTGNSVTRVNS